MNNESSNNEPNSSHNQAWAYITNLQPYEPPRIHFAGMN